MWDDASWEGNTRAAPVRAFYGEFALVYGDFLDLDSH